RPARGRWRIPAPNAIRVHSRSRWSTRTPAGWPASRPRVRRPPRPSRLTRPRDRPPDFAEASAQTALRLGTLASVDAGGRVTLFERRPARRRDDKTKGVARG